VSFYFGVAHSSPTTIHQSPSKSVAPRLKPAMSPRAGRPLTPLRLPVGREASTSRRRQVSQACVDRFPASSDDSPLQSLDDPDVEVFEVTAHPNFDPSVCSLLDGRRDRTRRQRKSSLRVPAGKTPPQGQGPARIRLSFRMVRGRDTPPGVSRGNVA
jgi:hypothetical protein